MNGSASDMYPVGRLTPPKSSAGPRRTFGSSIRFPPSYRTAGTSSALTINAMVPAPEPLNGLEATPSVSACSTPTRCATSRASTLLTPVKMPPPSTSRPFVATFAACSRSTHGASLVASITHLPRPRHHAISASGRWLTVSERSTTTS